MRTAADIYAVVERLNAACKEDGFNGLSAELESAMLLGSSGLEMLGGGSRRDC